MAIPTLLFHGMVQIVLGVSLTKAFGLRTRACFLLRVQILVVDAIQKRISTLTELDFDSINGIVSNSANLYEDGNPIWREFTMLRCSAQHR
jgi:hypothetical protein